MPRAGEGAEDQERLIAGRLSLMRAVRGGKGLGCRVRPGHGGHPHALENVAVLLELGQRERLGRRHDHRRRRVVAARGRQPLARELPEEELHARDAIKDEERRALAQRRDDRADDRGAALRGEIEQLIGQLGDLDHYSALGLEADANAAQIKKAYFKAAKKYHPDALARLGLGDLKEPAAQVFARIAEAFETLSDTEKRAAYDR
ncbi:MAG: DnaJ domain-containing protein, partial [Myxococcales bacterium]|nr:DnaJ domain-containing protein [Myxococcales bacterium]